MASLQLKSLVGKLNDTTRRTLESAAGLCLSQTHYHVEIEHWLAKLNEEDDSDLIGLLRHFELDRGRFQAVVEGVLRKMRTGNGRAPGLGTQTVELIQAAWLLASVQYGAGQVRSGHLLAALIRDPLHFDVGAPLARLLEPISADAITDCLPAVTKQSVEARTALPPGSLGAETAEDASGDRGANAGTQTPHLDRYTLDMTAQARAGRIDPVLGRDAEIRQLMDILMRRRQNNPILTGEPGVGKTAVVEGFALKIAAGDVPPALQDVTLRALDLGQLEAGAGVKGEFENRLKGLLKEVQASPTPIVLMIDEAHTVIGAGGDAGGSDAANLLKPALARGELRTIAATTWSEYKKYFEKDAALTRRFQVVKVEEPSRPVAQTMLRGVAAKLEQHHGVRILDEAIEAAVRLSSRYISGRQLPDKAVSVLDTACARIAISHNSTPGPIEDARDRCQQIRCRSERLRDEERWGGDHHDALQQAEVALATAATELAQLETQWQREQACVAEILTQKAALRDGPEAATEEAAEPAETALADPPASPAGSDQATAGDVQAARAALAAAEADLRAAQGEQPLMYVDVDPQAVAATISAWTGIPLGRMNTDQTTAVLQLQSRLEASVVGQSDALDEIARHIRSSRAGLGDPHKPIGVFLLAGTSGVGKTETALALADTLYGGQQHLTTINMSEFKEEHKVSLLMGSPPGYVGYGEGGVLTEAVRRKPYSVVLLDELEKAHAGVQDVFYQVFDKGEMKDGQGRDIDFKNTVVIITTNAGTDLIAERCRDGVRPPIEELKAALHEELLKYFKPAFLGRLTVLPYFPLETDVLERITRLKLAKVVDRTAANHRAELVFTDRLVHQLACRCVEVDTGARKVDQILEQHLLPELAAQLLARQIEGTAVTRIVADWDAETGFCYTFETDNGPAEAKPETAGETEQATAVASPAAATVPNLPLVPTGPLQAIPEA